MRWRLAITSDGLLNFSGIEMTRCFNIVLFLSNCSWWFVTSDYPITKLWRFLMAWVLCCLELRVNNASWWMVAWFLKALIQYYVSTAWPPGMLQSCIKCTRLSSETSQVKWCSATFCLFLRLVPASIPCSSANRRFYICNYLLCSPDCPVHGKFKIDATII